MRRNSFYTENALLYTNVIYHWRKAENTKDENFFVIIATLHGTLCYNDEVTNGLFTTV